MNIDEKFKAYVKRFAKCYRMTINEANKLKMVKEVKKYYEEEELDSK